MLLNCAVILQGSGAKYKSCSRGPHSEQMESGSGQERAGDTQGRVWWLRVKPVRSEENGF